MSWSFLGGDMGGGDFMGGGRGAPQTFLSQYNCSSTAMAGKDVDEGDKIFLPPSALDKLARMNVEYPMLFEIANDFVGKKTHCGVLEFSAEEGWCYLPYWMMQNLLIEEGALVTVKNVSLAKATFCKLRAQSCDFLEVSNPRALLEVALRKFTCLTVGDTICIPYAGDQNFYLDVREVTPNGAASIIETDCNVDFEEPLGYKDSKYAQYERDAAERRASGSSSSASSVAPEPRVLQRAKNTTEEDANVTSVFNAFAGKSQRIDGKASVKASSGSAVEAKGTSSSSSSSSSSRSFGSITAPQPTEAPSFQSRIGNKYSSKKNAVSAFTGQGRKLG